MEVQSKDLSQRVLVIHILQRSAIIDATMRWETDACVVDHCDYELFVFNRAPVT